MKLSVAIVTRLSSWVCLNALLMSGAWGSAVLYLRSESTATAPTEYYFSSSLFLELYNCMSCQRSKVCSIIYDGSSRVVQQIVNSTGTQANSGRYLCENSYSSNTIACSSLSSSCQRCTTFKMSTCSCGTCYCIDIMWMSDYENLALDDYAFCAGTPPLNLSTITTFQPPITANTGRPTSVNVDATTQTPDTIPNSTPYQAPSESNTNKSGISEYLPIIIGVSVGAVVIVIIITVVILVCRCRKQRNKEKTNNDKIKRKKTTDSKKSKNNKTGNDVIRPNLRPDVLESIPSEYPSSEYSTSEYATPYGHNKKETPKSEENHYDEDWTSSGFTLSLIQKLKREPGDFAYSNSLADSENSLVIQPRPKPTVSRSDSSNFAQIHKAERLSRNVPVSNEYADTQTMWNHQGYQNWAESPAGVVDMGTNMADTQTNRPSLAMNRIDPQTNRPGLPTNRQDLQTNRPGLPTNRSDLQTNRPALATNRPDIQTNKPALATTNRPTPSSNKPNPPTNWANPLTPPNNRTNPTPMTASPTGINDPYPSTNSSIHFIRTPPPVPPKPMKTETYV
ncbi:proteoglycan 4-like [Physella acuta]|uniref:proteoglycan 4-like n=1 Tax=Physella acuta TaxID=109671 RepID=UPI0027DAD960|nr:proteoglycan 4-like [Physella acuta]